MGRKASPHTRKVISESEFESILVSVKNGVTIDFACIKIGITRNVFYRLATTEQKKSLVMAKHVIVKKNLENRHCYLSKLLGIEENPEENEECP